MILRTKKFKMSKHLSLNVGVAYDYFAFAFVLLTFNKLIFNIPNVFNSI